MANLSYGSSGDEVKKLQTLLNQQGYKLDVDGSFGPKTQAAVKEYQKKNGLAVDGIVGNQTWGALSGSGKTASTAATTSSAVKATPAATASKAVAQWEATKPLAYQDAYTTQINDLLDRIMNGEKFSYDVNTDALYQQYKQQYVKQGQQAMQDTIGQSAALTGGYGSSYATTAGSQAYQSYLDQLNNMVPQLEQNAYAKYQNDQQSMYDKLSIYMGQEESAYNKYRDTVSDYWAQGDYLAQREDSLYNRDLDNRNFEYEKVQDELDREWDELLFEYQKAQDKKKLTSSSGGSGGRSSGRSSKSKSSGSVATYDEKKVKSWIDNGAYEAAANEFYKYNPDADRDDLVDFFSLYIDYDEAKSIVDKIYGTNNTSDVNSYKKVNSTGLRQEAK